VTQCVFITGASSGIGAALAQAYAARGAKVGLVARRIEELRKLAAELPSEAIALGADVRDNASMQEAAAQFMQRFGLPDIVIANAGVSHGTATERSEDIATFSEILDINVLGMVRTFQPFLTAMRQKKQGRLVGIASVAGFRGLPGSSAYSASKAAAISYLESLRIELRDSGINVTTLCPGYIATPMTARNPYRMPFMLSAEQAAKKMISAIDASRDFVVLPWQMALIGRIMRVLPNRLFDTLAAKSGRKPRKTAT
jgi:short-subunit dehydrogenase